MSYLALFPVDAADTRGRLVLLGDTLSPLTEFLKSTQNGGYIVDSKPFWHSKTFWLNALTFAALLIPALLDDSLIKQHPQLVAWLGLALTLANVGLRFVTDTQVKLLAILLAVGLAAVPAVAMAGEFTGATAAAADAPATIFDKLKSDPLLMAVVLIGVSLVASKVFKIDLSAFLQPVINSLLKPPGTPATPTLPVVLPMPPDVTPPPIAPVPAPVSPDERPVIDAIIKLLPVLLPLIAKAAKESDTKAESAK